ncbi:terminase, helicase domain [Microbacterium phage PauloDiaboli]|nr:terminase, helicase domain [Microbacterium phage PauloDiaboli]QWY83929.1 terminase large subunit, nuclease domain [Microbacterium phage A3Wally]
MPSTLWADPQAGYSSLRSRIESLPEPERSARRKLFTTQEWHSWKLKAYDHQLPPQGDDWKIWTMIGPPRSGATRTGFEWALDKLVYHPGPRVRVLGLMHHHKDVEYLDNRMWDELYRLWGGSRFRHQASGHAGMHAYFEDKGQPYNEVHFMSERAVGDHGTYARDNKFDFVWADGIRDSEEVVRSYPNAHQFIFTNPDRLHPETLYSRAN